MQVTPLRWPRSQALRYANILQNLGGKACMGTRLPLRCNGARLEARFYT